jgi:hypothetical protein
MGSANRPDQAPRGDGVSSLAPGSGGVAEGRGSVIGLVACALRVACPTIAFRAPAAKRDDGPLDGGRRMAGTMLAYGHEDGVDYKA